MKFLQSKNLVRPLLFLSGALFSIPAFAHVDVHHLTSGFSSGFLHPFMGLDHLLAMLAVGIWITHYQKISCWKMMCTFPLMMVLGALTGIGGVQLIGVESIISLSLAVLGVFIALSIRLPAAFGLGLIAFFAIFHGYAHGKEMPSGGSVLAYGVGFVLSTVIIQLFGSSLGLMSQRGISRTLKGLFGINITMAGLCLLFGFA
jgi:urease accessory protein